MLQKKMLIVITILLTFFICGGMILQDYLESRSAAQAAALYWGSRGDKVSEVQRKLRQWGYYDGAVDGVYGAKTFDAVKKFQQKNGLNADGVVGSNHVFAQIVICGNCGEVFRRVHWNNRGKKSIVWRCVSRLENTGLFCDARTVLESTIEQVLVTAINQTLCDKDSFLTTLQDNIATIITREGDKALADIDNRLAELQEELVNLASSKVDYEKVGNEIYRLRDEKQKQELQVENANRDELNNRAYNK